VVSAGLSPVLVTAGWLVADAVQPADYSPIRKTVSAMAGHAGTDRWIMTGALLLAGGCQLLTAAGLAGVRMAARIVLAVAGLSSIGIALSPEPVRGSTPQHVACTALGAVAIAVWPAFVARRAPPRPLILGRYGCAVVTAVFMVLLGWLVIETQGGSDLGLAERLSVSIETCWPFVVAVALRRTTRPRADFGGPALERLLAAGPGPSYVVSSLQEPPGGPAGDDGQPVGGRPVGEDRRDRGPGGHADAGQAGDQGGLDGAEAGGGGGGGGEDGGTEVDRADLGDPGVAAGCLH
jgi:hypothetical membrane protein